jgi:hypothetical protein
VIRRLGGDGRWKAGLGIFWYILVDITNHTFADLVLSILCFLSSTVMWVLGRRQRAVRNLIDLLFVVTILGSVYLR